MTWRIATLRKVATRRHKTVTGFGTSSAPVTSAPITAEGLKTPLCGFGVFVLEIEFQKDQKPRTSSDHVHCLRVIRIPDLAFLIERFDITILCGSLRVCSNMANTRQKPDSEFPELTWSYRSYANRCFEDTKPERTADDVPGHSSTTDIYLVKPCTRTSLSRSTLD